LTPPVKRSKILFNGAQWARRTEPGQTAMPANRLTTLKNANVAERVKIAGGVNHLIALDAVPCDMLDCIAAQYIESASKDELISMKGTLTILLDRIARAANE
jgi:hypothetical protein